MQARSSLFLFLSAKGKLDPVFFFFFEDTNMAAVRSWENQEYRMLKSHELVLMREGTRLSGENPRSQVEIHCIRVDVWLGLEFSTQSRSQSLRYPYPADQKDRSLWESDCCILSWFVFCAWSWGSRQFDLWNLKLIWVRSCHASRTKFKKELLIFWSVTDSIIPVGLHSDFRRRFSMSFSFPFAVPYKPSFFELLK